MTREELCLGTDLPRLEERFWRQVDKSGACWLWTGTVFRYGYGRISWRYRGKKVDWKAPRLSYLLARGHLDIALHVLHHCDEPRCVRPEHLWQGTDADNVADRVRKGRTAHGQGHGFALHPETRPRGQRHGRSKLSDDQRGQLRLRYARGDISQEALGQLFGLSQGGVARIVRGLKRGKGHYQRPTHKGGS